MTSPILVCGACAVTADAELETEAQAAQTYIVDIDHPAAADSANTPGTAARPWKTIRYAATRAKAGDRVLVKRGIYTGDVVVQSSGAADAWVTFAAYPGDERLAIVESGSFQIHGKDFVRVQGLAIRHSASVGFSVIGPARHIHIVGNHTFNTVGSGVIAQGVPWGEDPRAYDWRAIQDIVIEGNLIEKANNGGYNENITLMNGIDGFVIRSNLLRDGGNPINGGEGIDIKEGVANGRIWGNELVGLSRNAIYLDGGGALPPGGQHFGAPVLRNIEVLANIVHDGAGAGIGITTEGIGSIENVLIYNNIVYRMATDGIGVWGHPSGSGHLTNISIINNTAFDNSLTPGKPWWSNIHIAVPIDGGVIRNNVAWHDNNIGGDLVAGSLPATHNLTTQAGQAPPFVDAANGDFRPRPGSSLIGAADQVQWVPPWDYYGTPRPIGAADLGAVQSPQP